jgi:hypothetical protein
MSKTSVLWIALFALAGFAILTVCLLVVIGVLWFAKPAAPPAAFETARATPTLNEPTINDPTMAAPAALHDRLPSMGTPGADPTPPAPMPPAPTTPVAATDLPAGYTLINATPSGRACTTEKAKPTTVDDALEAGLDDLDDYFDDDYKANKFEDQRTHRSGIASFEALYKGKPVKGYVMAQLKDQGPGATLLIVFAHASASQAEWAALTGTANNGQIAGNQNNRPAPNNGQLPGQQAPNNLQTANGQQAYSPQADIRGQNPYAQQPPAPAPAQQVALQTYNFPDGTGSVGLAPGWTTTAQSCQSGFLITGPNGQKLTIGLTLAINTPNSQIVQFSRQYPGSTPLIAANFGEPAQVLQTIIPQISAIEERAGRPTATLDNVVTVKNLPPFSQGGKSAVLTYGVTRTENGRQTHYKALSNIALAPISNDSFMYWAIEAAAPDATAQQDTPLMLAMVNSWKVNNDALQRNANQTSGSTKAAFEAGQAAHRDRVAAFDNYLQGQKDNSTRQARSVDNFIETIRGTRDVQDTTTGRMAPVDLGNVNNVVDTLNQNDPGRYIQVPLRDRMDPLNR